MSIDARMSISLLPRLGSGRPRKGSSPWRSSVRRRASHQPIPRPPPPRPFLLPQRQPAPRTSPQRTPEGRNPNKLPHDVVRHEGRHAEDLPAAAGEPLPRLGHPADDRPGQGLRPARLGEQIIGPSPRTCPLNSGPPRRAGCGHATWLSAVTRRTPTETHGANASVATTTVVPPCPVPPGFRGCGRPAGRRRPPACPGRSRPR